MRLGTLTIIVSGILLSTTLNPILGAPSAFPFFNYKTEPTNQQDIEEFFAKDDCTIYRKLGDIDWDLLTSEDLPPESYHPEFIAYVEKIKHLNGSSPCDSPRIGDEGKWMMRTFAFVVVGISVVFFSLFIAVALLEICALSFRRFRAKYRRLTRLVIRGDITKSQRFHDLFLSKDSLFFFSSCIISLTLGLPSIVIFLLTLFVVVTIEHIIGKQLFNDEENEEPAVIYVNGYNNQGIDRNKTFTRVTRKDVDSFVPAYNTPNARKFDYLIPELSFNKILKFKELMENYPEISKEPFCVVCLEEYIDEGDVLLMPCKHYCHYDCMEDMKYVTGRQNRIEGTSHLQRYSNVFNTRCPLCQLNLLRHFLFYKDYGLDPNEIEYLNTGYNN